MKFSTLACLASACTGGGEVRSDEKSRDLSVQILAKMLEAESPSAYKEELSPALLAQHKAGLAYIQAKIPHDYPEPYFPYGSLANKTLDPGFVRPPVVNAESVALGQLLFQDKTLSFSEAHGFSQEFGMSCASCHVESKDFTDNQPFSQGVAGDLTHRNTPTLWNSAYSSTLTWSNPNFPIFEMQAKIPLFNDDPIEMGLRGKERDLLAKLSESPDYVSRMKLVYDYDLNPNAVDYTVITSALAAFERTLIRFDSPFDLYLQGKGRLSEAAKLGAGLFYGLRTLQDGSTLGCASCHAGFLMSDSFQYVRQGVYWNRSVFHESIRTPQLRFVKNTAPYFHDGSLSSLDEVLDFYARGERKSPEQPAFALSESERAALRAFFEAL